MSWTLITNEWRLKLLAFVLAVLMLGAVAFSQNPPTTGHLRVGLNYSVAPNIVLLNPPGTIDLTYSGLADVIARVNSNNLTATADASKAEPGAAVKLNVKVTALLSGLSVQNPGQIAVNIDSRQIKEVPVQVIARAAPNWSITGASANCPGSSTPNPCKVHFDGPVSWETNITATTQMPGLVSVGTIDSLNQPIQLVNANGQLDLSLPSQRTVPQASLDVVSTNIHVDAKTGSTSSTVPLVDSNPSHGPPAGYRVTGVSISPITVVITGDSAALSRVRSISLPPLDLSGSTSDATFQVAIPYPDGVNGSVANATVKYSISRNPNVTPSP